MACLAEWAEWVEWGEWVCNPPLLSNKNSKRAVFTALFFIHPKIIVMKSDEGFLDMLDKTILIDYLNENVITFQSIVN